MVHPKRLVPSPADPRVDLRQGQGTDLSFHAHPRNTAPGLRSGGSGLRGLFHEVEETEDSGEQDRSPQADQDLERERFESRHPADPRVFGQVMHRDLARFQGGPVGRLIDAEVPAQRLVRGRRVFHDQRRPLSAPRPCVNPAVDDPAFRRSRASIQKTIRPDPVPSVSRQTHAHPDEGGDDEDGLELLKFHEQRLPRLAWIFNGHVLVVLTNS